MNQSGSDGRFSPRLVCLGCRKPGPSSKTYTETSHNASRTIRTHAEFTNGSDYRSQAVVDVMGNNAGARPVGDPCGCGLCLLARCPVFPSATPLAQKCSCHRGLSQAIAGPVVARSMSRIGMPSRIGYRLPQPTHRSPVAVASSGKHARPCLHFGQTIRGGSWEMANEAPISEVYLPFSGARPTRGSCLDHFNASITIRIASSSDDASHRVRDEKRTGSGRYEDSQ
jgi:hypothetical protein